MLPNGAQNVGRIFGGKEHMQYYYFYVIINIEMSKNVGLKRVNE